MLSSIPEYFYIISGFKQRFGEMYIIDILVKSYWSNPHIEMSSCVQSKCVVVVSGRSLNLTTLYMGRLRPPKQLTSKFVHILSPVTDNCPF